MKGHLTFRRTESIARRVTTMVFAVALFFGLILVGFYLSSQKALQTLNQLHLINQIRDQARQIQQLQDAYSQILHNFSPEADQNRNQSILRATDIQQQKLFAEGMALTLDQDPQVRAQFIEARDAAERYRESLRDILAGERDFKTQMLIAKQFELESSEALNKVQILLKAKSDEYFQGIYTKRFHPLIMALVLTLIFMALSLFMGMGLIRRFNLAIGALLDATSQIAKGNLATQVAIVRPDEVGQLTDAFNRMTQNLLESTVSRDTLENIIESLLDSLILIDRAGNIQQVNQEALKLFGFTTEQIVGRPYKMLFQGNLEITSGTQGLETICVTKSGKKVPVLINVSSLSVQGHELVCVIHDITERKKTETELRGRNLDLAAANKELEAFSYSVSHDLRAPLRGIDGFSQALIEDLGPKLAGEDREYLSRIRQGVQRMGKLIDDMLDLSKLSRKELKLKPVDLSTMAHDIFAELKQSEPNRNAEFMMKDSINVIADEDLLHIMLENLIGNAWKYSSKRPAAKIEMGVTIHKDRQMCYIKDNGAGFDMTYSHKLFGAFQRFHRADEFPGTGVGLATVQRIVHRHGGTIWAESAVDQGTTFYFAL